MIFVWRAEEEARKAERKVLRAARRWCSTFGSELDARAEAHTALVLAARADQAARAALRLARRNAKRRNRR